MADNHARNSTRGVHAIASLRRMMAHADCLNAYGMHERACEHELHAERARDDALDAWRSTLGGELLPPDQIALAKAWVLACQTEWAAAAMATSEANEGLQQAKVALGQAHGHEDVTKALCQQLDRRIARQADDRMDRANEDRTLQGPAR